MLDFAQQEFLREKILEYVPQSFKRQGDKLNGRCPFCGDSKKSLLKKRGWIYLQGNNSPSYHCFNCGISLSGYKLLEFLSGANFQELKKEFFRLYFKNEIGRSNSLSSLYVNQNNEASLFNLRSIVKPEWKLPLSQNAKNYLDSRFITKSKFFHNDFYSWFDKKGREFILMVWKLNGIDNYFQINDFNKFSDIKYRFPKNEKKPIYGLDNIDLSYKYLIITEGVYDSLFLRNGCASGTKAITDYQLDLIKKRYPNRELVISFDNDEPGITAMKKLLKNKYNFKFFLWWLDPKLSQFKDINEAVQYFKDPNLFTDDQFVQKYIYSELQAKLVLAGRSF